MDKFRRKERVEILEKAINSLLDVIDDPIDAKRTVIDSVIQRFEYSYELTWKTLKAFLEAEGMLSGSPKDVFSKAYSFRWINSESLWLDMIESRNETSHTYNEDRANEVYADIKNYVPEFLDLIKVLRSKL